MYDGKSNLIGGEWCTAQDKQTFESVNPARIAETIGLFARSQAADVEAAVASAAAAYPDWRRTPAPVRGAMLYRMGQLLEREKERLSALMVAEMGKVLVEARGDVQEAIYLAYYIAAFGRMPYGSVVP